MNSTEQYSDLGVSAPSHHPAPELLIDYASGALSPAEMLLLDLHLAFCTGCGRSVRMLQAAGGELLDGLAPVQLAPDILEKTMRVIDRAEPRAESPDPKSLPIPDFAAGWPLPLVRCVAGHGIKKWRRMPAGFRALRVPFQDSDSRVWVMKAPGGRGPFPHSHTRDEWTVVLEGGFKDETGFYNAGDFAFAGPGDAHTIVAKRGEGCICVLLTRARPVYTTWAGKLMSPFIGV